MAFIDDLLDLMPNTVTVQPFVSRDSYGAASYGSPVSYRARVNYKTHNILGSDGQLILSNGTIWMACDDPMTADDRVTLDDGSTPVILKVVRETDETGLAVYTRVDWQ